MYRIGGDINIGISDYSNIIDYVVNIGYNIIQIFVTGADISIKKKDQRDKLIEFGKELENHDILVVIHGSYKINLCHPHNSSRGKSSIRILEQDLLASNIIGNNCMGVIIHMGKNISELKIKDEQAINNYISNLKYVLSIVPQSNIILETGASQGTEVASSLEGLKYIYDNMTDNEKKRIYFCIDTCHIWATGYNISNKRGAEGFFKDFDKMIGIDKIICIHFNDSKNSLASNVDRHDDLGYGNIGEEGLKTIAKIAKKNLIPLITETPLRNINPLTNKEITRSEELSTINNWIISK